MTDHDRKIWQLIATNELPNIELGINLAKATDSRIANIFLGRVADLFIFLAEYTNDGNFRTGRNFCRSFSAALSEHRSGEIEARRYKTLIHTHNPQENSNHQEYPNYFGEPNITAFYRKIGRGLERWQYNAIRKAAILYYFENLTILNHKKR
jgi:hypothetical protein